MEEAARLSSAAGLQTYLQELPPASHVPRYCAPAEHFVRLGSDAHPHFPE